LDIHEITASSVTKIHGDFREFAIVELKAAFLEGYVTRNVGIELQILSFRLPLIKLLMRYTESLRWTQKTRRLAKVEPCP
jgi:hypothetical protein